MKNLIIILLLILISCKNDSLEIDNNNKNPNISDQEIYEIINLVLKKRDWALKNVDGLKINPWIYLIDKDTEKLFNRSDSIAIMKTDTIFSKADLKFIEKQIIDRKDFRFKSKFITSKKIIMYETIDSINKKRWELQKSFFEIYKKKYGENWFCIIGLPVFSIDKKTAFVKQGSFMSGGSAQIYKKVNNTWEYCYSTSYWNH